MSMRGVRGLVFSLLLIPVACVGRSPIETDGGSESDDSGDTETESGDSGDTDAGESSSTDAGDGDGDPGDGDGDDCEQGTEGCACFPNDTCFDPLDCEDGECVDNSTGSMESCCDWHDSPGCVDPIVEACVCEGDEFCCNNHWDTICVHGAEACRGMCEDGAMDHANGDHCSFDSDCESGFCYYEIQYEATCQAECMQDGGGGENGPTWCLNDDNCCNGSCMDGACG